MEEVSIDGSSGEGGGQVLRSSLALSMVTGRPFRITRIRANRANPGLQRQHLTSVMAAASVANAETMGAELGSRELFFRPGPVNPGTYRFSVGTAGSTTLVFQTVLPALLLTGKPSTLTLEGGTHNSAAPCLDFLVRVFLPCLERMGVATRVQVERRGFYPMGGGRWSVEILPPASLGPLELVERGGLESLEARVLWTRIPADVAGREAARVAAGLGMEERKVRIEEAVDSIGPGNVILVEARYEGAVEVVTGFGKRGVRAEAVADAVVEETRAYLEGGAPVGIHLADQLLLPMVLGGGGRFRTLPLSPHSRTNIATIGRFLPRPIEAVALGNGQVEVGVPTRP